MFQKSFTNYLLSIESLLNMAGNFVPFSAKNTWILDWALTHLSAGILKPLAQPEVPSQTSPRLALIVKSNYPDSRRNRSGRWADCSQVKRAWTLEVCSAQNFLSVNILFSHEMKCESTLMNDFYDAILVVNITRPASLKTWYVVGQ